MHHKSNLFSGYEGLGNILWVNTVKEIRIQVEEDEAAQPGEEPAETPSRPGEDEPGPQVNGEA